MLKIYKAVLRELWRKRSRTILAFLSIFLVITFPVAMFSTAPSLESSIKDNNEKYKLCHLDLRFLSISPNIIPMLNETVYNHTQRYPEAIEERIITQQQIFHRNEWYQTNIVGINNSKSREINKIRIIEGTETVNANEVLILSSFAKVLGLSLHDHINLTSNGENHHFSIVGIVESIEFLSYHLEHNGALFLNESTLRQIINLPPTAFNSITIYFWEGVETDTITDISEDLRNSFKTLNIPIILFWHVREISVSAVFQDIINLTSRYLSTSAYLIMLVAGIVVFVITKRYAVEQRKQTGMLYAFGFNSKSILLSFLLRSFIITSGSIGTGIIASKYFLQVLAEILASRWGVLEVQTQLSLDIILEICIAVLIVVHIFTFIAARQNVNMTPYEAIRGKVKQTNFKEGKQHLIRKLPLNLKYPLRNLFRNKSRSILTVLAFLGAIMLSFSLLLAQGCVYETIDTYYEDRMHWDAKIMFKEFTSPAIHYDFLEDDNNIQKYEPYLESFAQPIDSPEMLVILRGISNESSLLQLDIQDGRNLDPTESDQCILSKYIAERLGIKVNQTFSFWFQNQQINVTVAGLNRDMDETASMFMYLEHIEQIIGIQLINGYLIEVEEGTLDQCLESLNAQPEIRFAQGKEISQSRIRQLVENQTLIVQIMVFLGFIVAFLIIFSTTFITIIERKREIALQNVFGFSIIKLTCYLFTEILFIWLVAIILGLSVGHFLTKFWLSIISELFFKIDFYFLLESYGITLIITLFTVFLSILPGGNIFYKQELAIEIKEE